MLTRKKVQTTILLLFAILVLVNILSDKLFFRFDFTADQRYSLSNATEDILENLDVPVTVTAYFSEDLPPDIARVRTDFMDLLIEYSNASGGQVVYEFVNPNEDQETEMKAQQNGIGPIMINVRERDQLKQQRAYLGAVVQLGEKKEVIPFLQPGAAMEYSLTTSIKKLTIDEKPKVGILQGHGEPALNQLAQVQKSLSILYDVQPVTFSDTLGVPMDINTLAIIAPKDTVISRDLDYLDEFLSRGGRLVAALNTVEGNLQNAQGEDVETGFEDWIKTKGIEIENNFLIDVNCSNVSVRQQQGMFVMNTPVSFPFIPIIKSFSDHPITEGLEAVVMPFVSPLKITNIDTSISVIPLAISSKQSGVKSLPLYFDVMKDWKKTDFPMSNLPVAVALEGPLSSNSVLSKMVIFGDGDFAVAPEGQQMQQDNISLLVNSIDWLTDDTGLVELRTKGVTARLIDKDIEDSTKTLLKYLNFLVPILLIIIYGIIRFQMRRKVKSKLMSTNYV
ncbi:MAG: Gldg family protein [Melioribacteraceae bacterium]|nr:Gldg family protein [Melioribacteraceae bacterium]MCF8355786.1 Gldg family protein [Melioribacteraceae bacterium]MCF8392824.1 Gldg family protein [Melioribacteraceae bacterium]MCF8418690.1 Gldg family protein [Melioribacteraceae bacterium]